MNGGFKWQARGLAGLVAMIEVEAEQDARIDASTRQTLTTWRDRLSAVLERLRVASEEQVYLPPSGKRPAPRYANRAD